jgi:RHH-type proline utilization regulon transcriptional repressor/proline dehydrogenase/delta 1-pyrroline-5-carboxylate dehydrogenase
VREAGKTWGNAVGEIREAVDFCRYYAQQLVDGHFHSGATPPGVAVCISPWNFPLAIFLGEVSAALAAGSPVIAKPAEQTPLIADFAVELLHRAGVPPAVLQLLPGDGETVGAALVADARVASVVFTGSTEVARLINAAVAERPGVRLIAETGGQNTMIVDSSALAEQVVQDVLLSGFDSAGQRCSALRVLCLQEDIAERTLALLKAAMAELVIGDPAELATDIGPVIDAEAQGKLLAHIDNMRTLGRPVHQLPLPEACAAGCYVPPTLIELESLADLSGEVFGPVVHVLRYADGQLDALLAAINGLGYGLTLGVHSRIDETVGHIVGAAHVGNLYVNRNMVGAVVGVQPFGGEGLSGTGPKAGGPLYLHRLGGSEETALRDHPSRRQASLHDPHSAFRRLAEWAFTAGRRELAQRCTEYAERSLLHTCFDLPGPTGERNRLTFAPRGRLLCLAADDDEWLRQLAAAFATGNTVAALDDEAAQRRRALLPKELAPTIDWLQPDDFAGLAGVLCEGDDAARRRRLAAEPGPLLPLYLAGSSSRRYPLYRMLAERVVSTNTTAAGGNTTLMTLGA